MAGFRVEHKQVNLGIGFGALTIVIGVVPPRYRYVLRRVDIQNNDGGGRNFAIIRVIAGIPGGSNWLNSIKLITGNSTFRFVGHWNFVEGDFFVVQNWTANTNPPFCAVQYSVERIEESKEE